MPADSSGASVGLNWSDPHRCPATLLTDQFDRPVPDGRCVSWRGHDGAHEARQSPCLMHSWSQEVPGVRDELGVDPLLDCARQNARLLSLLSTVTGQLLVDSDTAERAAAEVRELRARAAQLIEQDGG